MARDFNGTDQYLQATGVNGFPSGYPISMHCWLKSPNDPEDGTFVNVFDNGAGQDPRGQWGIIDDSPNGQGLILVWKFNNGNSTNFFANIDSAYSPDTWHCCGFRASGSNGSLWFDGTEVQTDASHHGQWPALDSIDIGWLSNFTTGHFEGQICEFAVWDRELTDAEWQALAAGFSPLFFPRGLLCYYPIFGRVSPEDCWFGDTDTLTVTGATQADHAPIIYPRPSQAPPGAGGAFFETLSATAANVATLSTVLTVSQTLSVTAANVPSLSKSISKSLSTTTANVPSLTKQTQKTLSQTVAAVASLATQVVFPTTLSVATTNVASLTKNIRKTLSVAASNNPTLTKAISKVLSVTASAPASLTKQTRKVLSVVTSTVPSLSASQLFTETLSVVGSMVATLGTVFNAGGGATLYRRITTLWRRRQRRRRGR